MVLLGSFFPALKEARDKRQHQKNPELTDRKQNFLPKLLASLNVLFDVGTLEQRDSVGRLAESWVR